MTDNNDKKSHQQRSFINAEIQQKLQQLLTDLQLDDAPAGGSLVVYQAGNCIAKASVGMAQADKLGSQIRCPLIFRLVKACSRRWCMY